MKKEIKELFEKCFNDGRDVLPFGGKHTFKSFDEWWHCEQDEIADIVNGDETSKEKALNLDDVIVSVCDCTHTQACSVCGESKGIDMRFLDD